MRHEWKKRRRFLKIHLGADIKSKKIISYKITDEHSHDIHHLPSLVEQDANKSKTTKVLTDGAYDSKNNFLCLYHNGIIPAIRVRKNSTGKARGCYPRKIFVISQLTNYNYWKDNVSCNLIKTNHLCNKAINFIVHVLVFPAEYPHFFHIYYQNY